MQAPNESYAFKINIIVILRRKLHCKEKEFLYGNYVLENRGGKRAVSLKCILPILMNGKTLFSYFMFQCPSTFDSQSVVTFNQSIQWYDCNNKKTHSRRTYITFSFLCHVERRLSYTLYFQQKYQPLELSYKHRRALFSIKNGKSLQVT